MGTVGRLLAVAGNPVLPPQFCAWPMNDHVAILLRCGEPIA